MGDRLAFVVLREKNTIPNQLTIEMAVYMDSTAYASLAEVLDHQGIKDSNFPLISSVTLLMFLSKSNAFLKLEANHS